jgi:hypothetical protein
VFSMHDGVLMTFLQTCSRKSMSATLLYAEENEKKSVAEMRGIER